MESLANLVYQRQLSLGEQIVALLVVAVFGLARVAGDGDDGLGAVLGTMKALLMAGSSGSRIPKNQLRKVGVFCSSSSRYWLSI